MSRTTFEEILPAFGETLGIELIPDHHDRCCLKINGTLSVQLEKIEDGRVLLISSMLGTLAAGKYREDLLENALKANGFYPKAATLCYIRRANELALFRKLELEIDTLSCCAEISSFIDTASSWQTAIRTGRTSP